MKTIKTVSMKLKKECDFLKEKIAIIDLGSNSARMHIIGVNEFGAYSIFEQAKEMVRLSEGLNEDAILKPIPIERTIKALNYFKRLIDVNNVKEVYALSTAAVRMAKNKDDFLMQVKESTGFEFRILSGEEEAYYDYLGVINSMDFKDAVIIDIGGGSSEIIWVENRKLKKAISLPIGSVILTEMFKNIKNKKKRIEKAEDYTRECFAAIHWLKEIKELPVIGLGGVIRTIGKVDRNQNDYPIENMHNYHMTIDEVNGIFTMIFNTNVRELGKIEGINRRRADLMTLGILPLKTLLETVSAKELRISGNGLREGYFYEVYFSKQQKNIILDDVLVHSSQNIMKRFCVNEDHAQQVKKMALTLFEKLKVLHDFTTQDRKILKIAALLHDIGMHIEYYDHHIHGMYLLLNSKIDGLTNFEHIAVAFLVGNHRQKSIKERIKEYEPIICKKDMARLEKLSVFLQIAEQLDRVENGVVKNINVKINNKNVKIALLADENPELDIESAMRFKDKFEKYFNRKLEIYYCER